MVTVKKRAYFNVELPYGHSNTLKSMQRQKPFQMVGDTHDV